jgi:hypothetical protein
MKAIASSLLILSQAPEANAAACAAGVYHAGCVGPRGTAVVRHPATVAVRPVPRCYMRAGIRVCR